MRLRIAAITFAFLICSFFVDSPAHAQTTQASLSRDTQTLSNKFTGLARVMAGKYDWKPGAGVRSVGEVFNLIVAENRMLLRTVTGATGPMEKPTPITDPEKLQSALKDSYAALEKAISAQSDSDLKANVKLFGREMTKEDALHLLLADQHEHLGQSIAYARMNGVAPPWSK